MTGEYGSLDPRIAEQLERERPAREYRASALRILHDIVVDCFDGARVGFEQHYDSALEEISSFAVFHNDHDVRSEVEQFVRDAIPQIGLKIEWDGGNVIRIPLRRDPATADEMVEMMDEIYARQYDEFARGLAEFVDMPTPTIGRLLHGMSEGNGRIPRDGEFSALNSDEIEQIEELYKMCIGIADEARRLEQNGPSLARFRRV